MSDPQDDKPPGMSMPDAVAAAQLGEYRVLQRLGRGGMGLVYKALHTELDRVVALKVLLKERTGDEEAVRRFQREMKAVARLDHPNIVRAHDAREIAGRRVLVMEYVEGLNLAELVGRLGRLPVADACELVRQTAVGLEYAHHHGLVHRDVKPSNLILNREGKVKILDLGLALVRTTWTAGKETTGLGQLMGTPDYMAPEQASDSHNVDSRADLYSLGCTLYELLVGRAPFSGQAYQSAFNKMNAHVNEPAPPIRQSRGDVPELLASVLDRMLAKAPQERFPTAGEVVDALGPFATGCDLLGLLSEAEGKPRPAKGEAERAVEADRMAMPAATSTPRGRLTEPRPQPRRPAAWRRKAWAIAAGLALLVAGVGLTAAILFPPAGSSTAQSRLEPAPDPPTPPPPQPEPRRWLVLSWSPELESGKPDLWLFDGEGQRRRVTDEPDWVDLQPTFSPDGRRIAFIRADSPRGASDVYVCNTDGSGLRRLVPADSADAESPRLLSPVWVSNSVIYYAQETWFDRGAETEIWQVDVDGKQRQMVFRVKEALEALGVHVAVVTDVSPDGRLALIGLQHRPRPTSDVYVTDSKGNLLDVVWQDADQTDTQAVWSPDGQKIAWHHGLTPGPLFVPRATGNQPDYHGVGLARLGADGKWETRFQPGEDTQLTPIGWTDDSNYLLCARLHAAPGPGRTEGPCDATLFLMDTEFLPFRELFSLRARWQQGPAWAMCRLGDWALVPEDALPPPLKPR